MAADVEVLRQQLNVLRRTGPKRPAFSSTDRLIFVGLYRLFPVESTAAVLLNPAEATIAASNLRDVETAASTMRLQIRLLHNGGGAEQSLTSLPEESRHGFLQNGGLGDPFSLG